MLASKAVYSVQTESLGLCCCTVPRFPKAEMTTFRVTSFAITAVVLFASFTDCLILQDKPNEIDQDLASILDQADTPDAKAAALDISVLSGFVPKESIKDTREETVAFTDRMLNQDERRRKVNKLMDFLSKDESQPPMDMPQHPPETVRESNVKDDKVPEDLLNDLKSGRETQMDIPERQFDPDLEREEGRMDVPGAPGTYDHGRDGIPMDIPAAPGTFNRARESMDIPRDPETVGRDKEGMDMPEASKANDACSELLCKSKKELATRILMDELVNRMKSYLKRGEDVPKRMVDIWRKYRTKRRFKNLKM